MKFILDPPNIGVLIDMCNVYAVRVDLNILHACMQAKHTVAEASASHPEHKC